MSNNYHQQQQLQQYREEEEEQQQPHFEERQQYDAQYYTNEGMGQAYAGGQQGGPHQLYIDVMSSDGVSTITGPYHDDTYDPVGVYLPPPENNNGFLQPQGDAIYEDGDEEGDFYDENAHPPNAPPPRNNYNDSNDIDNISGSLSGNLSGISNPLSGNHGLHQSGTFSGSGASNPYEAIEEYGDFDPHNIGPEDFDPVGAYIPPETETDDQSRERRRQEQEYYERYAAAAVAAAAAAEDHGRGQEQPQTMPPQHQHNMRYDEEIDDEYDEDPRQDRREQQHQHQEEHVDEEFYEEDDRRHEYNARVNAWFDTIEDRADQNDESQTRVTDTDSQAYAIVEVQPEHPQNTSPITVPTTSLPPSKTYASPAEQRDERRDRRHSRTCFLIACLCLLLIVIVVGVVLYFFTDIIDDLFGLSDDDGDPAPKTANITNPPTSSSPSFMPSMSPTPNGLSLELQLSFDGPAGFGSSVAQSSRFLLAGSPSDTSTSSVQSLFGSDGKGPYQSLPLIESGGGDAFGFDLGLLDRFDKDTANDDAILLVGSPRLGSNLRGGASLFRFVANESRWEPQGDRLVGLDAAFEEFGFAVALSDDMRAVVGAPGHSSNQGRVFTYTINDNGGVLEATPYLSSPLVGAAINSRFGEALDIASDGSTIAVGEPGSNTLHLYEWDGGEWVTKLDFSVNAQDFGSSVSFLSIDVVAAGAPSLNGDRGAIYVIQRDSQGAWAALPEPIEGNDQDRFGTRHTIGGRKGSDGPEVLVGTNNGFLKRFDWLNNRWVQRYSVQDRSGAITAVDSVGTGNDVSIFVGLSGTANALLYSLVPEDTPTNSPIISMQPTFTSRPSLRPSVSPSDFPTSTPSRNPSSSPTISHQPSLFPSERPSSVPTTPKEWALSGGPLTTSEQGIDFGFAVSVASNFVFVGAPEANNDVGEVSVFNRTSGFGPVDFNFTLGTELFGYSLDSAISSGGTQRVLVGAMDTKFTGFRYGSAHFFELGEQGWREVGSGMQSSLHYTEAGGHFGAAVAMATTVRRAIIGAPSSSVNGSLIDTGRVYAFEFNEDTGDWEQMGEQFLGATSRMYIGTSVDMLKDGSKVLIGAPGDSNGDGSAALYEWTGVEWNETFVFQASAGSEEALGTTVAFLNDNGSLIGLGAPKAGGTAGAIRIFEENGSQYQKSIDIGGLPGQSVGTTLSGAQGRVAFGTNTASFHVFANDGSSWGELSMGPSLSTNPIAIALSEDGDTVAVGLDNEQVLVYDLG